MKISQKAILLIRDIIILIGICAVASFALKAQTIGDSGSYAYDKLINNGKNPTINKTDKGERYISVDNFGCRVLYGLDTESNVDIIIIVPDDAYVLGDVEKKWDRECIIKKAGELWWYFLSDRIRIINKVHSEKYGEYFIVTEQLNR